MPEHGRVPKYFAVARQVSAMLADLRPGDPVPTERELVEQLGCARETLRRALDELVLAGRLHRTRGRGTTVAEPKLILPLVLRSYTESLADAGMSPQRRPVRGEVIAAGPVLAGKLGIANGDKVVHLERLLIAENEPIGLESTYVSLARFPTILEDFDPTTSLYRTYVTAYGIRLTTGQEIIETVLASPREAQLLGTNPALPMLLMHRDTWDEAGEPVEHVRALWRGDRYAVTTALRG
ncbi:GntR family transcriptional regulator [Fodinicola feengrottensis]|uniref:GntR family transcriptional regulator n=1 Tax=Fodinicola feengrottensis TaxID=435914 RepID=UPI0024416040|nr:GntR family transcriptional regulator [Fodinicola feengrottensis]